MKNIDKNIEFIRISKRILCYREGEIICSISDLYDSDCIYHYSIRILNNIENAFVIRYKGAVYSYINRCQHWSIPLNMRGGGFFDNLGRYLKCDYHGALYEQHTGICIRGPCIGSKLIEIKVIEKEEKIILLPE